jgi:hypothetical protein
VTDYTRAAASMSQSIGGLTHEFTIHEEGVGASARDASASRGTGTGLPAAARWHQGLLRRWPQRCAAAYRAAGLRRCKLAA